MKQTFQTLLLVALSGICGASDQTVPIKLLLYDSLGLTSASAPEHRLQLIIFGSHLQLHVSIINAADQTLTLWRPGCPEGDDALIVEFREPSNQDKIYKALPGWDYTGGSGVPKTLRLEGHDSLLMNVDFFSGQRTFPIAVPKDARKELEIRVRYQSRNLTGRELLLYRNLDKVWEGEFVGDWQKILVINRSDKNTEAK